MNIVKIYVLQKKGNNCMADSGNKNHLAWRSLVHPKHFTIYNKMFSTTQIYQLKFFIEYIKIYGLCLYNTLA